MTDNVAWDRSYTTRPIPAEGRVLTLNTGLLRVLNDQMGSPAVQQVYGFDGVSVSTVQNGTFFSRDMVGGRLVLGNPGDSQFAFKFFSGGTPANPSQASRFNIRYFSMNRGETSVQTFCNVNPNTGELVAPECADLTQAPEITEYPIAPNQVETTTGQPTPCILPQVSEKARILMAALGELPTNDPHNRAFIRAHQSEINALRARINATQK